MDKTTLIQSLDDSAAQFIELVKDLNKDEFEVNVNNKWSAGQDLVHLIKVLQIVNIGGGAKAPTIYIPKPVSHTKKDSLIQKYASLNKSFIGKLNDHTPHDLNSYRLPHPILGKISLVELASFTSFHTSHHFDVLKSKLAHLNNK